MGSKLGSFLRVLGAGLSPQAFAAQTNEFSAEQASKRSREANIETMGLKQGMATASILGKAYDAETDPARKKEIVNEVKGLAERATNGDKKAMGAFNSAWLSGRFDVAKAKGSPEAKRAAELEALGVDKHTAQGIGYRTYKTVTADDGTVSIYDLRNEGKKLTPDEAAAIPEDRRVIAKGTKVEVRKEKQKIAAQAKLDKELQSIKDDLGGPGDLGGVDSSLAAVEKVMKGLKGKDIPGFGVTAKLPDMAISKEGKDLRVAVKGIFNRMLKLRSGAAVTDPELLRLMDEFATGAFKTDDQLREGLRLVRVHLNKTIANIAAGHSPEAIKAWDEKSTKFGNTVIGNRAPTDKEMSKKRKRLEELRAKQRNAK